MLFRSLATLSVSADGLVESTSVRAGPPTSIPARRTLEDGEKSSQEIFFREMLEC